MRAFLATQLDKLCAKLHFLHEINVPESWFEEERYAGWRGRVCNLIYGCPLAHLADRVGGYREAALRDAGTPWGYPARKIDFDDPWNDGMDWWGDPTDYRERDERNEALEQRRFYVLGTGIRGQLVIGYKTPQSIEMARQAAGERQSDYVLVNPR